MSALGIKKHPLTNPDKPSAGRKAEPENSVLVHGSIQAYPPPEVTQKHEAERKEDAATHEAERQMDLGREAHKVWLERLTLVAVVIYAGITLWQGRMTRESIDNNTKQFQIDQRPYVWTSNTALETSVQKDQHMWINISPVNFGKAPAVRVKYIGKIFLGTTAKADADKWFSLIGDKEFANPDLTETLVPPGIPTVFPPPTKGDAASKIEPGKPQATMRGGFGGGGYLTLFSDNVLTQPQVDYVLSTDESAYAVLRVRYFDIFGNQYWSDVCMSRYRNGSVPFCATHNEIH
jgi:hypothetical protein